MCHSDVYLVPVSDLQGQQQWGKYGWAASFPRQLQRGNRSGIIHHPSATALITNVIKWAGVLQAQQHRAGQHQTMVGWVVGVWGGGVSWRWSMMSVYTFTCAQCNINLHKASASWYTALMLHSSPPSAYTAADFWLVCENMLDTVSASLHMCSNT